MQAHGSQLASASLAISARFCAKRRDPQRRAGERGRARERVTKRESKRKRELANPFPCKLANPFAPFRNFGLVICRTKLVKDNLSRAEQKRWVESSSGRHPLQVATEAKKCVVYTSHFQLTSVAEVEIIALALRPIFSRLVLLCAHPFRRRRSLWRWCHKAAPLFPQLTAAGHSYAMWQSWQQATRCLSSSAPTVCRAFSGHYYYGGVDCVQHMCVLTVLWCSGRVASLQLWRRQEAMWASSSCQQHNLSLASSTRYWEDLSRYMRNRSESGSSGSGTRETPMR